jgi:Carboxypeptidase regulatory-like domain
MSFSTTNRNADHRALEFSSLLMGCALEKHEVKLSGGIRIALLIDLVSYPLIICVVSYIGPNLTKPFYTYEMIPNQSRLGVITGRVLDSLGKGISKARVSIVQENTGIEFPRESDTEGNYEQTGLLPGKYTLTEQAKEYNSSRSLSA